MKDIADFNDGTKPKARAMAIRLTMTTYMILLYFLSIVLLFYYFKYFFAVTAIVTFSPAG